MKNEFEVWILGLNEDDTVNDYELLIATFKNKKYAIQFADHYPIEQFVELPRDISPKFQVVVEQVIHYKRHSECIDRVYEREL